MNRERAFDAEVRDAFAAFAPSEPGALVDESPLWTPNPGAQTDAYYCLADELFYGGAGGGGKSDLELGLAITAHHSSVIFRSEFAQFRGPEGLIERSKEVIGSRGRLNEQTYQWRGLPGGRSFEFAGVAADKALAKWKGRPHDLKAFDEITEFTEYRYRFLNGWLRTSIPGQRTRTVATGNPPTTSAGQWVIAYWAPWLDKAHPNPAKPGELRWFTSLNGKDVELLRGDPLTLTERGGKYFVVINDQEIEYQGQPPVDLIIRPRSRTFIPARVEDNPHYMRTGYVDVLNNLPEPLRSQLRFGDFQATQEDNPWQVIPTAWVKAAQQRWRTQPKPDLPLSQVGNDPSRGGQDKFCIAKRYGHWVAPIIKHAGKEAPDGQAGAQLLVLALNGETPMTIGIDIIGSAGSSVFDQARDLELPVVALNGSMKSVARDKSGKLSFFNKRAEWHWNLRELLDPTSGQDIALPDDPELLSDLTSTKWRPTPRGIRINEKQETKELIGRSPDTGEAVIYAFAEDTGDGAGFLVYANQQVAAAKAKEQAAATPAPEDVNPWMEALPKPKD